MPTTRRTSAVIAAVGTLTASVLIATPAHAAVKKSAPRHTFVMDVAQGAASWIDDQPGSPRKMTSLRALAKDAADPELPMKLTGAVDRNHDGLDDDGRVTLEFFANRAVIDLAHRNRDRSLKVYDGGFRFKNTNAPLKEAALNLDSELRAVPQVDSWDAEVLSIFAGDLPAGVTMTSVRDANRDGFDDDGRVTLLKGGKAVTLVIGASKRDKGVVQYGPTWKNKAPKRTHKPVSDVGIVRASEHAAAEATTEQFSKILQAESAMSGRSPRSVPFLRDVVTQAKTDGLRGMVVTGIGDKDGDGLDDDARIVLSFNKGQDQFTLTLPPEAGAAVSVVSVTG